MHDLQLVGFTTDRRGLIFRPRAGARSDATFVIPVTDDLVALVAQIADERAAAGSAEAEPSAVLVEEAAAAEAAAARPRSQLSVRDIQARLRAGEPVAQVAAEAGVDDDWIERFAPPVRAEQRRIVERALEHHLHRSRSAPSAVPLRRAVGMALAEKGIAYTLAAFEAAWSAHLLGHDRWAVEFTYRHRGRDRTATWSYDADADELTTSDRTAAQLGYVAPGAADEDDDGLAIDGIVGDPEATTQIGTASEDRPRRRRRATSAPPTARRAPARATGAGKARPASTTKASAAKKAAAKKATAKKAAAKKAAAKKAAAKKVAARKAAAKKVAAKSATPKRAAARKAAAKKSAAKQAAVTRAAVKKAAPGKAAAKKAAPKRKAAPAQVRPTRRTTTAKPSTTSPAKATTATATTPAPRGRVVTARPARAATPTGRSGASAVPIASLQEGGPAAPLPPSIERGATVAAPDPGNGTTETAPRLFDEAPRPGRPAPRAPEPGAATGRVVAGRPGEIPIADIPLADRPPAGNGRVERDDRPPAPVAAPGTGAEGPATGADPASARRARAAERSVPTVQFRSGSAAPVRAVGAADGRVRRSPEPDPARTEPAPSNGAASPATRRRRQLRAK